MRAELAARAGPLYRLRTALGPLDFRCGSAEAVKAAARFIYDEPETVWWIDHIVQPGDCVWDVGANVGLYALYAARRVGAGGTVIAFEPAADNYAALCRNVTLNPPDAVTAIGIFAAYRNYQGAKWRATGAVAPHQTTTITMQAGATGINVTTNPASALK